MKNNIRKIVSVAAALALVVGIVLTGTYAWRSISQTALNETVKEANPGGRLHDDFNGTNKDVYVENYTDPEDGGVPIFARIRLDEYMEIGTDAGAKLNDPNRSVTVLGKDKNGNPSDINNKSTWTTHLPNPSVAACKGGDQGGFHSYWTWTMGGSTVYMPTFNKDNTSLKADINGTLQGLYGAPYDDYRNWQLGDTDTADENYADNVVIPNVTHEAAETPYAEVITMERWYELGCPINENYWVYDVDGWAYWAGAIEPGQTTGLLLTEINMTKDADEDSYYAIHVVAQFASRGDWGDPEKETGFYDKSQGEPPTKEALYLLNKAAGRLPQVTGISIPAAQKGILYVRANETLELEAQVDMVFPSGDPAETYVVWDISSNTSAFDDGKFTPTNSMIGSSFTVTATSSFNTDFKTTVELYVIPSDSIGVEIGDLDGKAYVKYADNTYKEILPDGTLAAFKCAGKDMKIGNTDDKENVKVMDDPVIGKKGENFGTKFLGPYENGIYLGTGEDGLLGTADDIRLISGTGVWAEQVGVPTVSISGDKYANAGTNVKLTATTYPVENGEISWSLVGSYANGTSINSDGELTISPNEPNGTKIKVMARTERMGGVDAYFEVIANELTVTIGSLSTKNGNDVARGMTKEFYATLGNTINGTNYNVAWKVEGGSSSYTTINSSGLLSVDFNETVGDPLTVTATVTLDDGTVLATSSITQNVSSKVRIDGDEWWVVAKKANGDVLLLHKEGITFYSATQGDPQPNWAQSEKFRFILRDDYLPTWNKLKDAAQEVTIYTRTDCFKPGSVAPTQDKIFLLSEADLLGTTNSGATVPDDYTYNGAPYVDVRPEMLNIDGGFVYEFYRSPHYGNHNTNALTVGSWAVRKLSTNTIDIYFNVSLSTCFRPAMFVDCTVQPD